MQEAVRAKARGLLESGVVECVIGYERATDSLTTRPAFAYTPEDAGRLVYDQTCVHNLAKYLLNRKNGRTGIVAKPCDSRTINLLIGEKQVERDRVYIIGVVCQGMPEVRWNFVGKDLHDRCKRCVDSTPVVYDDLVGRPVERASAGFSDVEEMEAKTTEERRAFWRQQFDRCIRCYACRQVCPGCYCTECFVDQLDPTWVGIRKTGEDNEVWNTIRAFHLAGRCISCNECERACPMGIPLSLVNRKLVKDVADMFEFQAGIAADTPAPFATFKKDEHLKGTE